MPIFRNSSGRLKRLSTQTLDKEKSLQQLIEANLTEVLDLQFLATEYATTFGGRIDTLAVDNSGAPVIIEYKRNKNDNVINQALSYLKWLKTQKSGFFEKLIIDKLGAETAKAIGLDWSNPRVVCIAESYSKFDIDTVEVVPLRIELLRYRYYEDNVFALEPVTVHDKPMASDSAAPLGPRTAHGDVETVVQSSESLSARASPATKDLFEQLREKIRAFDDSIIEKPTSLYVAFKLSNNFAEVHIGKNQLKIFLRPIEYDDPRGMVEKIPEGYNWTLDRRIYLKSVSDIDYVAGIVEQSYKSVL